MSNGTCNHLFGVAVAHGCELIEYDEGELRTELNRGKLRYVHNPANADSLGTHLDYYNYCPRCGTPLLPIIETICTQINNSRNK